MNYNFQGEKTKICHICSNYDDFFIGFMDEQILNNLDIRVFYFRAKDRGLPEVRAPYLDIRLNYRNRDRLFFFYKEKKVFKDFISLYKVNSFSILHAHTLFSNGYIALRTKKKYGVPYVVAIRDMDINVFLKYRIHLRKLAIEILNEADNVVFLSERYRKQLIDNYVPKKMIDTIKNKSCVIPNGINEFYLNNLYYRDNSQVINNTIVIITVGHVSKRKNQLSVCKAIDLLLNTTNLNVKYKIIGKILDRNYYDAIRQFSFVEYIPFVSKEKLINEYRNADIFVMPSITETFGLTYIEAMSQGLPIIYSENQGIDGHFSNGQVGYNVRSKNKYDIVESIKKILNNYNEISIQATHKSKSFNWHEINKQYEEIYSEILSKNNFR